MKPAVFQVLVIVDSVLLLAALTLAWLSHGASVPLLTAVLLAGLNAALQSAALDPLPAGVRVTLRAGGAALVLATAILLGTRALG